MKALSIFGLFLTISINCSATSTNTHQHGNPATVVAADKVDTIHFKVDRTHSSVAFKVGHLMVSKVKGTFDDFSGSFEVDEDGNPVSMEGVVQILSVNTRNEKRDDHLRNDDFFSAKTYPTMSFKSTSIKSSGGKLLVNGSLTMRGVTRPLALTGNVTSPVDAWGKTLMGVSLSGTLNREDFGMTWNKFLEAGGVVVGKEVELDLEFELVAIGEN